MNLKTLKSEKHNFISNHNPWIRVVNEVCTKHPLHKKEPQVHIIYTKTVMVNERF